MGRSPCQINGTEVEAAKEGHHVSSNQSLAPEVLLGKRIPSVKILSQADARPWHLQEVLPSNGRWRLMVFPGDIRDIQQNFKLERLAEAIDKSDSFLHLHTPKGARYDEVFEILTVHNAPRKCTTIFDFPQVLRPYDDVDGWDYNKIFVDDDSYHEGFGRLYETFGISKQGCVIIIRPDQYVSYIGPLDDCTAINNFFGNFMVLQRKTY